MAFRWDPAVVPFLWSSAFCSHLAGSYVEQGSGVPFLRGLKSMYSKHFSLWFMWSLGLFLKIQASVATTFGFFAAFIWVLCSGVVFLFPTWVLLAVLTGKPVFVCETFGCESEVLDAGSLSSPKSGAFLCQTMRGGLSAPL